MTKIILFSALIISTSFASDISKNMTNIYKNMLKLQKAVRETKCPDSKEIFSSINKNITPLGKHFFTQNQGYSVAYKNFKRNLKTLEESCQMKVQDTSYRKNLYLGLVKSCFHCHSSDRMDRELPPFPIQGDTKEKIELYMMSRNYKQAEIQIDKFFKNIDYKKIGELFELEQNLFLKVHNDPEKLVSRYKKRLKTKLKDPWNWRLQTWIFELENLPQYDKPQTLFVDAQLFIKKRIGLFVSDSERIRLKYLLGRLHHYLHEAPKKEIPEVLYYLGSLENRLEHNFYSVDNLYLMECLGTHGKSKFGKKCFDEFMSQINFSFTGSSGTKIPKGVKELIKELTPTP